MFSVCTGNTGKKGGPQEIVLHEDCVNGMVRPTSIK